ncbi:MAG: hypothetical protein O7H41_04125 [Planctomycetota bacterium]|nr:hypothetical protein [Planctomycetota bacterium]
MVRPGLSGLAVILVLGCSAAQPRVTGHETDPFPSPIQGNPPLQNNPWDLPEPARPYPEQEIYAYSPRGPGRPITVGASVGLFSSYLFGSAVEVPTFLVSLPVVDYDELWDPGVGFHLEGRLNFLLMEKPQRTFSVGPFVKLDRAVHPGNRAEIDNDLFWDPDDFTVTKLLIGARIRGTFSHFIVGGQLSFGLAFLSKVDYVEEDLGIRDEGELFEETTTYGLELSTYLGGRFPVGPGAFVSPYLYAGIATTGAPEKGDGLLSFEDTLPVNQGSIGIGIAFEFGGSASPVTH